MHNKMFCLPPKLPSWWLMVCKIIALLIDEHNFFFANVIGQQNEADEMFNIRKLAALCYSLYPTQVKLRRVLEYCEF